MITCLVQEKLTCEEGDPLWVETADGPNGGGFLKDNVVIDVTFKARMERNDVDNVLFNALSES